MGFEDKLEALDVSLFDKIQSQTSADDKKSLLFIQRLMRSEKGNYSYLEIGSHLGGSMQPFLVDENCDIIYSIDKRPEAQPDQRGRYYEYKNNTSQNMVNNLSQYYDAALMEKIVIFDCDAKDVDINEIKQKPDIIFIDGEHTNEAVLSDFFVCKSSAAESSVILFHDSQYVYKAINIITDKLKKESVTFKSALLKGCVYAIFLGPLSDKFFALTEGFRCDEEEFFRNASVSLFKMRLSNRFPLFYGALRKIKSIFIS